jgi:catechol 2,3-dioxygenase-like lactoylglutathione lyase family enzyme
VPEEREVPAAPPLGGVAFLTLRVRDPKLSARWYGGALGFVPLVGVEQEGVEGAAVVVLQPSGGLVLALQTRGDDPSDDDEQTGPVAQIGLGVESPELVAAWAEHFDKLGLTHSGVVESELGRMVTLADPDGVQVSVVAARVGSP